MKKLIAGICVTMLLASCGNDAEKKASEKLSAARSAFAQGDYNEAKLQIDSIKILYPKAFDARREGIQTDATGGTERTAADFSLPGQHDADQAAGTGKNQK